jgi:hypothetical protein
MLAQRDMAESDMAVSPLSSKIAPYIAPTLPNLSLGSPGRGEQAPVKPRSSLQEAHSGTPFERELTPFQHHFNATSTPLQRELTRIHALRRLLQDEELALRTRLSYLHTERCLPPNQPTHSFLVRVA